MKKEIHPKNYRQVIFTDGSNGKAFLCYSTVETDSTAKWTDGKEYPEHRVEITSASHPFYTGQDKVLDSAGRVDKFRRRQKAAQHKTK